MAVNELFCLFVCLVARWLFFSCRSSTSLTRCILKSHKNIIHSYAIEWNVCIVYTMSVWHFCLIVSLFCFIDCDNECFISSSSKQLNIAYKINVTIVSCMVCIFVWCYGVTHGCLCACASISLINNLLYWHCSRINILLFKLNVTRPLSWWAKSQKKSRKSIWDTLCVRY